MIPSSDMWHSVIPDHARLLSGYCVPTYTSRVSRSVRQETRNAYPAASTSLCESPQ